MHSMHGRSCCSQPIKQSHVTFLQQHKPLSCKRFSYCCAAASCLQDAYFLDSASEINFFFEEKAFNQQGQLQMPKALAVNKIGHAMHDMDPVFSAFTRSQPVSAVLRSLGFQRPLPVQSMYIFKQPSIGGEVVSAPVLCRWVQ